MTEKEWRSGALEFLRLLGLRWAAVTSPLKGVAFETSRCVDALSAEMNAVNTLKWNAPGAEWLGANTDIAGLKIAVDEAKPLGPVAVWGGGGTLAVIQKVIPDAQVFSSRTGENRLPDGVRAGEFNPQTVVWAVGRSRENEGRFPPQSWRPRLVFDLNYADDSPGREYAFAQGCRYFSGLSMFKAQAAAQRSFWSE
jgi:shikimate 5-dehydrogenase